MGLTRTEFFSRLGLLQVVEPLTDYAFAMTEQDVWVNDRESSPHGQPWHTSFHASQFPGDDPLACGRKAMYGLMNIPEVEPTSRWLRGLGEMGNAIEDLLVRRWGSIGALLSAGVDDEFQTGFVDPEVWLTASCDAIVVPHGWNRGHVVEVKGKALKVVQDMQHLMRGPDPRHINQVKTYIGQAHETFHLKYPQLQICEESWALAEKLPQVGVEVCPIHGGDACLHTVDMKPVVDGTIFYCARDDPNETHEFLFGYDRQFMETGKERLAEWRDNFKEGVLPERPDGWMWSKDPYPCRLCPFKGNTKGHDVCKADDKAGVTRLEESNAIATAKRIRPNYDYEATRATVLGRWKGASTQ